MGQADTEKGAFAGLLDALGFLWQRLHLVTFDKPQADGVDSRWTRALQPVGTSVVQAGELVELVSTFDARHVISAASALRFDLLEEDFFLSGGFDDLVASLATANSTPRDGYEVLPRAAAFRQLDSGNTLASVVQLFKTRRPDYDSCILIVAESSGATAKTHVITWWRAQRVEDFANSELYFLVNVDDRLQDGAEQTMEVTAGTAGVLTLSGKVVNAAGVGIAGATVVARDPAGTAVGSGRTDAAGLYRLDLAFQTTVTLRATSGFITATQPVTATDANRTEPLVVADIQLVGRSLTGTVRWPSWTEPAPLQPAAERGSLTDVANHFAYTPPPAEAFVPAVYPYDRTHRGVAFGGAELIVIRDPGAALEEQDWVGFRMAADEAATTLAVASSTASVAAATRGAFLFDSSLAPGDYLLGPKVGYRILRDVDGDGLRSFSADDADVAAFVRLQITAAGAVTVDGRAWDEHLYVVPVVELSESGGLSVPDRVAANLQLPSRATLADLVDTGRLLDVSRLDGQYNAEEQEALLRHTVVRQPDGRRTMLFDHALTGFRDRAAVDATVLPWVPLTDDLALDAHTRRRDDLSSADFGRYPLRFLPAAAGAPAGMGRFAARDVSREIGDDVREVKVRLLVWGSATEHVDPNEPTFDAVTERALIRFKHACHGAVGTGDPAPAQLTYFGKPGAHARRLYPHWVEGRTFTGVCDRQTFRALGRFVSDEPHPEFALERFRIPGAAADDPARFGRLGFDRILVYALESLRRRLGGQALTVQLGVRSWQLHTLADDTRDLSVNHPGGYAVKVRPTALAPTGAARLAATNTLRDAAARFGVQRGKAGPPGIANNLLPPMPVGLTAALRGGQLLMGPTSWLEQGVGANELGADHRAPIAAAPASVAWHLDADGIDIQGGDVWDGVVPANHPEFGVGHTRLLAAAQAAFAAAWALHRPAIERWARYYGVPSEILIALTATESANYNARSCRVEPITGTRAETIAVRDERWNALGCGPFPGGPHAPAASAAGLCPAWVAWFDAHEAVRTELTAIGNIVPVSPGGAALVTRIRTRVEAFAPAHVSPGMIQTLISTARSTLAPEFTAAAVDATVTTEWLLGTYDPQAPSNSIRAGAAYVRQLVNSRGTLMDPPLVSAAYNAGGVYNDSDDPTNRWRMNQFENRGAHTSRVVAYLNEAVEVFRGLADPVNDNLHVRDALHLDTFMLHHSRWELEFVVGDALGGGADPDHPGRPVPAAPHASRRAQSYSRTNPQALRPPAPPVDPVAQATALRGLTNYLAEQLESYETTAGNPATRVWMRLMWTFAKDARTVRGVRSTDNVRVQGTVRHADTDAPLVDATVELEGSVPAVRLGPTGYYVLADHLAALPDAVEVRVRVGAFVATRSVPLEYPGAAHLLDIAALPIRLDAGAVPQSGPAAGGTTFQVTGEGFNPADTTVTIGGQPCTNVAATTTTLSATAPAGATGAVDVVITTPSGSYTAAGAFRYT